MGRKKHEKIPNHRDWNPRINDIPEEIIFYANVIKEKLNNGNKFKICLGDLLCAWIINGVIKDAKRLKLEIEKHLIKIKSKIS